MKEIIYAWREGASTAQEACPDSRVFYLRQHKDANLVPGPTEYNGIVEVYADGTYEFKLITANQNIPEWLDVILGWLRWLRIIEDSAGTGRGPRRSELMAVSRFIESLPGVKKGGWRRADTNGSIKGVGVFSSK